MTTQHAKSPCCRGNIHRFGGRRRQCRTCKKTWRIRPSRRGRKRLRMEPGLAEAYLSRELPTIRVIARRRGVGRDRVQRMLRQSLVHYVARRLPTWADALSSNEPLIAVPDGIWYRVRGERRTAYLILLRPVEAQEAVIAPPLVLTGHEDLAGWETAFATLQKPLQERIEAIVCDGGRGIVAFARSQPVKLQRCHFHLIANLQMYCGTRTPEARQLLSDVRTLITTIDPRLIRRQRARITEAHAKWRSLGVRRILSGLMTSYPDFQTYLRHPELNLPTTTNAAESCVAGCQELKRRLRGFRSEESMQLWLTGHALWKKTIVCNGKKSTK